MYKKILVPLDGSELAQQILPYVRSFAQAAQSTVELLRVNDLDSMTPYAPPFQGAEYLGEVAKKYFSPETKVEQTVELGAPAMVILDRAGGDPTCLIAMATHGMSGMRRWLMGSVAAKVAQAAMSPLLLIRPGDRDAIPPVVLKTIFVPLDGSALAEKALPHVIALGKNMKSEVHLVRVYAPPPSAYVVADGMMGQGPGVFRESIEAEAAKYLDGKIEQLRAAGLEKLVATPFEGDAAAEIIDIARKTPNSLIAMSTHGRSGFARWVLGSVAEKVIQHSQDPVLLIRAN